MATETITLKLVAQDLMSGNVSKAIAGLDKLAQRGGLVGSVMQGVGQSFGQMLNPVAAVGNAIGAVTDFMGDSISAASDQAEALSKVTVVFGEQADEIEAWAKTASTSMGMSETAALSAAGTLGNLFDALGIAEEASADMSTTVTQLAADLASFNNVPVADAIAALQAGLVGETEPMRRFGSNISAARVEAYALAKGMAATKSAITDSMKVQARYALIMEDTKNAQGDFARTSDGLANSQKSLSARFEDLTAKIGGLMQGPAQAVIGFFDDLITRLAPSGESSLPPRVQTLIDKFTALDTATVDLARNGLVQMRLSLEDAQKAIDETAFIGERQGNRESVAWVKSLGAEFVSMASGVGVTAASLYALAVSAKASGASFEEFRSNAFAAVNGTANATTYMVDAWTLGMGQMATVTEETGDEIAKVRPRIRSTAMAMLQTMNQAKEPWRTAWQQLAAWAKDPFKPNAFENWIDKRADRAVENARKAAQNGKPGVARRWREIAAAMRSPVTTALVEMGHDVDEAIQKVREIQLLGQRIDPLSIVVTGAGMGNTGGSGNRGSDGTRARGGPVSAGGTYLVGEEGPEVVTMGGDGFVTPNHALGGAVHLHFHGLAVAPSESDLERIARVLVPALDRQKRRSGT